MIDPAVLAAVVRSFEEQIPFNQVLGLRVEEVTLARVIMRFDKRPEHVGNYVRGTLHGGVTSAVLDTTGGLVAFVNAVERLEGEPEARQREILTRVGTIDLRVDYLRAATGERFRASGNILRAGSRVAVTRMELHDEADETLVAVGTGTYSVG